MKEKVETLAQKIFKPIFLTYLIDVFGVINGALATSLVNKIFNKKDGGFLYEMGRTTLMTITAFIVTYPFTYLGYEAREMIKDAEESMVEE